MKSSQKTKSLLAREDTIDPYKITIDPYKMTNDPYKITIDPYKMTIDPNKMLIQQLFFLTLQAPQALLEKIVTIKRCSGNHNQTI